jgi:outer membrane protein assembly factor BamB
VTALNCSRVHDDGSGREGRSQGFRFYSLEAPTNRPNWNRKRGGQEGSPVSSDGVVATDARDAEATSPTPGAPMAAKEDRKCSCGVDGRLGGWWHGPIGQ